tara:strand:+ start:19758 stop:20510 length:753 start_codon:yes stop_codon:yes gene_type:complete
MSHAFSLHLQLLRCTALALLAAPVCAYACIPPAAVPDDEPARSADDPEQDTHPAPDGFVQERTDHAVGHAPNPMLDLLDDPRRYVIVGTTAYVANLDRGLMTLDMTDPEKPVLIGQYNTPGISLGVTMVGSTVFVADGFGGLVVVDARNPAELVLLGQQDSTGYAYGVSVINDRAYLTQFGAPPQEIDLLDLELPCRPDLVEDGVLDIADIAFFGEAYDNQHPLADMNNDGVFDFYDVAIFFDLFSAGCP